VVESELRLLVTVEVYESHSVHTFFVLVEEVAEEVEKLTQIL